MNEKFGKSNHIDEPLEPVADCIICGAGASRRMGEWKLSLPWPRRLCRSATHEPWLVDGAVSAALDAGCRVILVAGYREEELEAHFSQWPGVTIVRNDRWHYGMVSSVKAGLLQVRSPWFFIAHADMPLIPANWYRRLLAHCPAAPSGDEVLALRPQYYNQPLQDGPQVTQGLPGHPVLFSASAIPLIQKAPEGDSLKTVLSACRVIQLETQDPSVITDIDSLEQYGTALVSLASSEPPAQNLAPPVVLVTRENLYDSSWREADAGLSVELITGIQGAGKTSFLRRSAFQAFINMIEHDISSQSLFFMISQVQTGRSADGKALGFDIEAFFMTPEGRLSFFKQALCRTDPALIPVPDPLILGPYYFNSETFTAVQQWIASALETSSDHIFGYIDELGKLELDQHRGLWPLFEVLVQILSQARSGAEKHHLVCTVRQDRVQELTLYLKQLGLTPTIIRLDF